MAMAFLIFLLEEELCPAVIPKPRSSYILINDGKGNFSDQTENICPELLKPGMITDAAWVDLDLDKKNELVVVGEWMPVTGISE